MNQYVAAILILLIGMVTGFAIFQTVELTHVDFCTDSCYNNKGTQSINFKGCVCNNGARFFKGNE